MITKRPLRIFASASPGLASLFILSSAFAADPHDNTAGRAKIEILLQDNCYDCHDDITQKGNIRLDTLVEMPVTDRLELLNKMLEQVYWYATLLNAHGNPIKHYGDLDPEMTRKTMPQ